MITAHAISWDKPYCKFACGGDAVMQTVFSALWRETIQELKADDHHFDIE